MNTRLILTATTLAVVAIFIAFNTSTNHHVLFFFTPTLILGSNNHLHTAEIIHLIGAVGPKSLAFSLAGEGPYTGVADGRILKWQGDDPGWVDFAFTTSLRNECVQPFAPEIEHICGSPLGLRFDKKTGDLYIPNAYFGLQVVGPNGGLATQLVAEVEGRPLRFTNDMDIDKHQDVIYFTDTSTSFHRRETKMVWLEVVLSPALQVLFDELASGDILNLLNRWNIYELLLDKLKIAYLTNITVVDDAEEKQYNNLAVETWLGILKHAV